MSKRQNPPFFGFTSLTERSIGAGPPVIIQLSGVYECHVSVQFLLEIKDGSQYNFTIVILNKDC